VHAAAVQALSCEDLQHREDISATQHITTTALTLASQLTDVLRPVLGEAGTSTEKEAVSLKA